MPKNKVHKDQKYINGLAENNSFIIQSIYDKYAPKVVSYIRNNNGTATKAKDIIQEVLITIYNQATEKNLQLTCPFDAYFFLLCKRKWLNELKKTASKQVTILKEEVYKNEEVEELVLETSIYEQQQKIYETMFQQLGNACKELLKTCFVIKSMEEVAKKLNISYAYARKKKSECTGKLTQLIQSSLAYKKLKNNF